MIKIKRAYESSSEDDGFRILVDRIWPRGVSKEKANLNTWMKEIAPSNDLRKWFSHDPGKWEEFENKYKDELEDKQDLIKFKALSVAPLFAEAIKRIYDDEPISKLFEV